MSFHLTAEDRAPYITGDLPAEALLPEGHPHILGCPILGWPLPDLLWYKSGVEVVTQGHITAHPNGSLEFAPVLRSDQGVYICVGSNAFGSTALHPVNISVAFPPELTLLTENVAASEGSSIRLKCSFYGDPKPTVTWSKDEEKLDLSLQRYHADDDGLRIASVEMRDQGMYTCIGSNEGGVAQSHGRLIIQARPEVVNITGDLLIEKGNSLRLLCTAEGIPLPLISFHKDGEALASTPDRRVEVGSDGSLLVRFVAEEDRGVYGCKARNVAGTDEKSVQVMIQGRICSFAG
ncbi:hypothetical protein CAPTEDRAFT_117129 [Capitella teleta]|uniref:Ig-like domain-containing protein n=1 Tax=Capitella teleta TaxID=283909 RepID=R7UD37_CAPTE|nr:hypothetical protein CAPTEDRAFT_117129 [Capitella teleta]|eukprot:ELU04300.1 hypothetical protein CAPTEDRAFT_117129 [Capitella teleta]